MKIFQDKIYRIEQLSFFISPLFFIIILAIIKLIVNHEILLISKDATPHFMMLCILTLASMILVAGLFSFIQISFFIIKKKFSFLIFRIFFLLLIPIEYGFLQEYRDSIRGAAFAWAYPLPCAYPYRPQPPGWGITVPENPRHPVPPRQ